jgi:hypothetical protein
MNQQPSKQLRWVGQPSEEELLGIPVSATRRRPQVTVRTAQAPPVREVVTAPSPVRGMQARELLTVLAVAGLVWLMLGGAGAGSRFWGMAPVAPEASAQGSGQVVVDRRELGSLPRAVPSSSQDRGDRTFPSGTAEGRGSTPGGKDEPRPPGGGSGGGGSGSDKPSDPPLVQATLPVVGTVTLDEPETLALPEVPELPSPSDVVPETPTVPLP